MFSFSVPTVLALARVPALLVLPELALALQPQARVPVPEPAQVLVRVRVRGSAAHTEQ